MHYRCLAIILVLVHGEWAFAAYEQEIHYVGMSCNRVQKDSIAHPDNEVYINTAVHEPRTGRTFTDKHPYNRAKYTGVKRGYRAAGPGRLIWRGRQQALVLYVMMWEHDSGGKSIDVASELLSNAIQAKMTSSAPPGQPVLEADKDPLTQLLSKGYRRLLGAEHDLMGYARVVLGKGDWSARPVRRLGRIRYHHATRHTRGGADCRAYFLFKRGARYADPRPARTQAPSRAPARPRQAPPPDPRDIEAQCRQPYYACANSVQSCQDEAKHHNQRVKRCERHGWRQYEQCVNYYQTPPRNKRYSLRHARSLCRGKYDTYLKTCPRQRDARCRSYAQCDNIYRRCVTEKSQRLRHHSRPPAPGHAMPRAVPPTPRSKPREVPRNRQTRRVTLTIVNQCPHLSSIALHYKTGRNASTTRGWFPAYLDKESKATIQVSGDDLYVNSSWGKVVDPLKRNIRKQLPVSNRSFSYTSVSSFAAKDKRFVYFFPYALQGRSRARLVLSCKQCMRCTR